MRITIFTAGTQGDVRPLVALGLGLTRAGHAVRIATGNGCAALIEEAGLEFAPLSADFLEVMKRDPAVLRRGRNPLALLPRLRGHFREMTVNWAAEGAAAAADADLLIGNGMTAVLAASLSEVLGVPWVETQLQPTTPCPDIPPMALKPPRRPYPAWVNLALYRVLRITTWQMLAPGYTQLRRDLDLPPLPRSGPGFAGQGRKLLYGFSPTLCPPSPHWPEEERVTGYWHLDTPGDWRPQPALQQFLEDGPPPVYAGFGSMHSAEALKVAAQICAGIRASGRRAILATGWGGMAVASGPDILTVADCPHDWLFPRVALAIHHGGAGTAAAAARAGIPSVVMPRFGDQPFWAWCLQQRGIAPPPLEQKRPSVNAVAGAVRQALTPEMQAKARAMGARMRQEDGIGRAIAQLRDWGLI